jgi:hypothetical protein
VKYNTTIVLAYFAAANIPKPELEYRFCPTRKWRFDFAWPFEGVALEVEGGVWTGGRHTRGSGFVKDVEKYNAAAVTGWCVLRCQPRDLTTNATVNLVKRGLLLK